MLYVSYTHQLALKIYFDKIQCDVIENKATFDGNKSEISACLFYFAVNKLKRLHVEFYLRDRYFSQFHQRWLT